MNNFYKKTFIPCIMILSSTFIDCSKQITSTHNEHMPTFALGKKIMKEDKRYPNVVVGPALSEECPCERYDKTKQLETIPPFTFN